MEISAQYVMTPKELRRGLLAIGPVRQLVVYAAVLIAPAAGATHWFSQVNAFSLVVLAVLEPLAWYFVLRAQRRQIVRLSVPTTLALSAESVTITLPESQVTHRWSAFLKLASARDFWLFYTNKQCAVIVPKRAFSGEQRAEIEEFVRRAV